MNDPQRVSEWCLSRAVAVLAVCLVPWAARAQASLDSLWGVYTAEINGGVVLYGIVRQPANFQTPKGTVLEVFVAAAGDGETTAARRLHGEAHLPATGGERARKAQPGFPGRCARPRYLYSR